jgi:hypothetical protein
LDIGAPAGDQAAKELLQGKSQPAFFHKRHDGQQQPQGNEHKDEFRHRFSFLANGQGPLKTGSLKATGPSFIFL